MATTFKLHPSIAAAVTKAASFFVAVEKKYGERPAHVMAVAEAFIGANYKVKTEYQAAWKAVAASFSSKKLAEKTFSNFKTDVQTILLEKKGGMPDKILEESLAKRKAAQDKKAAAEKMTDADKSKAANEKFIADLKEKYGDDKLAYQHFSILLELQRHNADAVVVMHKALASLRKNKGDSLVSNTVAQLQKAA